MKLISTIGMAMACLYMALPNTASSQIDTTDCELDVTLAVENDCAAGGSIVATATGGTYPLAYLWDNGSTDSVLTELNTGIYTLIVVDINGCSDTASEDVDLSDGLATNYIGTLTNCNAATGSIELSPSGGTAPYTFLWSTGETAEDLNGLAGGIYIVTVTDANGCSLVESIDVSAPELGVVPTLSADTCGQGTGSISIAINGGNPPFNIIWSTGDTLTALMNLTAGSYSVSVTDSAACEATATVEILELSGPAITTNATNAGCGDTLGSAIVVALGGTGPLTINWSTGDTGSVSSALLAGSYTVTVVDAYGCSAVDTFEITSSNGTAPEITYAATNPGCGETNGAIDVTVSGGTGPFTFDWSSGETTEDLSNLSAGTYMVTVTNADGCAAMATIDLSATGACDAPLNITSNVTNYGAIISCDAVPCAMKYRVRVKRLGALGGAWSTYFVNASQSSLMLDSLVPGAIYKFRVRSQCSPNGADLSAWSAPQYFTVNAGVAVCAAPSGIATANASASGTDINWTPVTGAYGYRIRYREIGTTGWTPMVINNGNIASFTLSGLQASTTFEFQIATKCEVGPTVFSTFSPIGTFTTTGLRFAELDATYTLALYPNPASSEVNLQIPHELANAELVVYNAVGQVVRQLDIANETSLRIDVSHLAAGLYVVELRSAQTRIRGRLVKE